MFVGAKVLWGLCGWFASGVVRILCLVVIRELVRLLAWGEVRGKEREMPRKRPRKH